jgi:hypothetical protein
MRDVRTLRTLALLDLEAHPPAGAIEAVTVVIDPTPARVLQHTLFSRAQPTAEQLSTLLARLHAVMGAERVGAPAQLDTYRPGAFATKAFAPDLGAQRPATGHQPPTTIASALRRCRQPVPARVAVVDGRPVRVTTDRRGYAGGAVVQCAGPWRTSGAWWAQEAGGGVAVAPRRNALEADRRLASRSGAEATAASGGGAPRESNKSVHAFDRDEWDVLLNDDTVYRVFEDRDTGAWFIDAIVD